MVNEILRRLEMLESVVGRLLRVGVVTSVYPERGTVRVQIPDVHHGETSLVTRELPVRFDKTCKDKQYHMPDIGEHVMCLFLPTGQEQGCVLGAIYSQADAVPVADPDKRHFRFDDGSWFEYDRKQHLLSGHVVNGCAELTIDKDLTADIGGTAVARVEEDLSVDVGGNAIITAGGELTAESQGVATLKSASTVRVEAPQIVQTGNITSSGAGGAVSTEVKTANVDHTGDVEQQGNYRIRGTLHVTDLVVDNPINGVLAGGA